MSDRRVFAARGDAKHRQNITDLCLGALVRHKKTYLLPMSDRRLFVARGETKHRILVSANALKSKYIALLSHNNDRYGIGL